jgi:hypothetical protein
MITGPNHFEGAAAPLPPFRDSVVPSEDVLTEHGGEFFALRYVLFDAGGEAALRLRRRLRSGAFDPASAMKAEREPDDDRIFRRRERARNTPEPSRVIMAFRCGPGAQRTLLSVGPGGFESGTFANEWVARSQREPGGSLTIDLRMCDPDGNVVEERVQVSPELLPFLPDFLRRPDEESL